MTVRGKSEFLNSDYEDDIFNSVGSVFQGWLYEKDTTVEQLQEDIKESTENTVGRILGAEQFTEGKATLFFEYLPDTYNHPARVCGKPIKGIPDFKTLEKYAKENIAFPKPLVLCHDFGMYITCVTDLTVNISPEILEQNMTILKGKAQENWDRILHPENYFKKKKK